MVSVRLSAKPLLLAPVAGVRPGAAGSPGLGLSQTDGEAEVPAGPTGLSLDPEPGSWIVSADCDHVEAVEANRRGDLATRRFSQFAQIGSTKQNEDSHGTPQYRRGNSVEPLGKPVGMNWFYGSPRLVLGINLI